VAGGLHLREDEFVAEILDPAARPTETRAIQARLRQGLGLRVRVVPLKPGIPRAGRQGAPRRRPAAAARRRAAAEGGLTA
jgi:hypothetical protein